jgi:putative ABC transport system substrate-binding protein
MTRREVITVLASAAAAWPVVARAQQLAAPVVGLLRSTPSASFENIVAALRRGLTEVGFVEGRDVMIEQRWAEGRNDRLSALLADLINRQAAVIVANTAGAFAAKAAATKVPVVFATGSDPVRDGLVASLNRPGANWGNLRCQRAGDKAAGTAASARPQGDDCGYARHAERDGDRGRAS